jgi:hypothetical protein
MLAGCGVVILAMVIVTPQLSKARSSLTARPML